MILTILILIVLLWTFYTGWRRGMVGQLVYFIGYAITFFIATQKYEIVGQKLELWIPYPEAALNQTMTFYSSDMLLKLSHSFYAAMGFMLIMFIGWVLTHFIGIFFRSHRRNFIGRINRLCGGVLNMIFGYIGLFLILYVLTFIPINAIQLQLAQSPLAQWMIRNTPLLSEWIYQWWIVNISQPVLQKGM